MLRELRLVFVGLAIVAGLPLVVYAEGITGSGVSEISHPATSLRMQVDITAEGKNIAEAIDALKAKREALAAQLGKLGASADSITFSSPRMFADPYAQQRRMEMMMQARMGGSKAAKGKQEEKVTIASTGKAQWALKGTPDEILARAYDLRKSLEESLKAKPGAGAAGAAGTTGAGGAGGAAGALAAAEEQENAEENAAQYAGMEGEEAKPGTPVFVYVAQITPAEREKALADAMSKAREQAAQAAKAAGVQLGNLRQVSQHVVNGSSGAEYGYSGAYSRALYQMMNASGTNDGSALSNEAIGADMASVKVSVVIEASWEIK